MGGKVAKKLRNVGKVGGYLARISSTFCYIAILSLTLSNMTIKSSLSGVGVCNHADCNQLIFNCQSQSALLRNQFGHKSK